MPNFIFSEASGLNKTIYGESQAPIRAFLEKRAEAFEQEAIGPKLFKKSKSSNWAEKFSGMTAMEGPRVVGENGKLPVDGYQVGYEKLIEHQVWKDSFAITREMIDDAKLNPGKLFAKPQAFLTAHYRTMEKFAAAMFAGAIQGKTTMKFADGNFDLTCNDGGKFFATEHPSITNKGPKQSNCFAAALTADALDQIEVAMHHFTDDNGNLVAVAPDTIIIPDTHAARDAAFSAVGAEKLPYGSSQEKWNMQFGRWNIIVWPYLSQALGMNSAAYILMDSKYCADYDVAVWLDRVTLEIESRRDPTTKANVWDSYCRFGAGFVDWRGMAVGGVTGGTSFT